MPQFGDPFGMEVPRKLSNAELAQAIRLDLGGELEAIYLYDAHVQATDDPLARKVLADIRDEEKEHMGELLTLLQYLAPDEAGHYREGSGEVKEMMEDEGIDPTSTLRALFGTDVEAGDDDYRTGTTSGAVFLFWRHESHSSIESNRPRGSSRASVMKMKMSRCSVSSAMR